MPTVEMPHQRPDQACPDDNVALNNKGLDKNNIPETHALAGRSEQGVVKPGEDVVSLPTHTAPNPSTEKVLTARIHHQRMDQPCPEDNVESNIKVLDKNNMSQTYAHAGRYEQGVMKPGEDVSSPTNTACPGDNVENNMPRHTRRACIINDVTRLAQVTISCLDLEMRR